MQINITGRHIDTGEALRDHVEARLLEAIGKYFARDADVNVTFSKSGHAFKSDCAVHLDSGMHLQASSNDNSIYASFDQTIDKIAKQLRRYKRKLKNHHGKNDEELGISLVPVAAVYGEAASAIIAEPVRDLPSMTLAAAVEMVEEGLVDHVLFQRNDGRGHSLPCLVRRRPDGHIGWLEVAA
jgi:ribosomal subunit interface protein